MKLQERRRTRSQQPVIKSRPQLQGQVNDRRLKDSSESALRRRGEEEKKKKRIKEEQVEPSSDSTGTADREQDEIERKRYQHQPEEKRQKEQMTNPEVAEISAAEQRHHGDTVLSKKEPSGVSSTMPEQKKKISRKPI